MLLATSALASAALPAMAAPGDATWNPGNADFNADANWTGTPDKTTPVGIATFNASSQQTITFSKVTTLGGMTLNQDAVAYTFDTNGHIVTFNGAGLSVGSGASLVLSNGPGGGGIRFINNASGGTARIKLDNGALDISGLTTAGTGVGSLEGSGNVFLGSKNLFVGSNNRSTAFSGVIQDSGDFGGAGGSLTKEGTGALTLSGINTYTGATVVSGGTLVVDGTIEHSSGVTVNAGGTLAGIGTVSATTVNDGGTLAPGQSEAQRGSIPLGVRGDLTFSAGATYRVPVFPHKPPVPSWLERLRSAAPPWRRTSRPAAM